MVERGDLKVAVLATGTIQPYTRVEISSAVRGRIDSVEAEEGNRVQKGETLAWVSSEERIALIEAARSALESGEEENDPEAVKKAARVYEVADRAYKPVPIATSINGEVIKRSCEPGQNVSSEDVLFVVSDRLVASVEVDEADIGRILPGQVAQIWLDAFPDERTEGKVVKISREGRIESDVVIYDVMVNVARVPSHWSAGMTANVEFVLTEKSGILLIPKGSVRTKDGAQSVRVLEETVVPRPVQTGLSDGRMVEITSGLQEGETIVLGEGKDQSRDRARDSFRMMRRLRR
jgi:macrolide-specific efflux system membrane fusion protein